MSNLAPFALPNNPARLVDNSGESQFARINGLLYFSNDSGATWTQVGTGGGSLTVEPADPWFATQYAALRVLDPLLTDVTFIDDCSTIAPKFQANAAGSGTATLTVSSAFDIQTGASANSTERIGNVGIGAANLVQNIRTNRFALAVKVTKIGVNTANSDHRMANLGDEVSSNSCIGITGGTSTANYSLNLHTTHVDTGKAQSAAGTYDTLIMWNDTTNYHALIALGAGALVDSVQSTVANAQPIAAFLAMFAGNGATAANQGFRVDKVMLIQSAAT